MTESTENVTSALTGMLDLLEAFTPVLEFAKGLKTQMEADGWSPTAAEDVAREFMAGAMHMMMRGGGR